jgi:uncharacterized membrane protein YraQ (UPF0718 family)
MTPFEYVWSALVLAAAMAWKVGWSLLFGFILSGVIQAVVPTSTMQRVLGKDGAREIMLATLYGAASSSCSYASASIARTLIEKGAGFISSLAFLFASTNLVIELGVVLYILMGWQFTAAEWLGGVVLVAIMSVLVRLTYPQRLVLEARANAAKAFGNHDMEITVEGTTLGEKLRNPRLPVVVAQHVAMDWGMMWKDVIGGFLIAGALAAFIPDSAWKVLFLQHASPAVQLVGNAVVGTLIAIFTFVCSIGNVPMAAVLWGSGISFGGVLAFLYADLIVLPLLDVYRKYFGWKMALYIGAVFFVTMVLAAIVMNATFAGLHLVPLPRPHAITQLESFAVDYTFWLNLVFLAVGHYIWQRNVTHPMHHHRSHGSK